MPGKGRFPAEGCIESMAGPHDTQTIGTQHPDTVQTCHLHHLFLQCRALFAGLGESGRVHHRGLDSVTATLLKDIRHSARRRGDHRQIYGVVKFRQRLVAVLARHRGMFRIDGVTVALEAAAQDVAVHMGAHRALPVTGTEYGNGSGFEQLV